MIKKKENHSEPYIYKNQNKNRISFQIWEWENDIYSLKQFLILGKNNKYKIKCFETKYRAIQRNEITECLKITGFEEIEWLMPSETDYYQPIVIARKKSEI